MSDLQHSVPIDHPRQIDVSAIEQELGTLWKQAEEPDRHGDSPPVVRACAFNLVVVSGDRQDEKTLDLLIDEVTAARPARTFVIATGESDGPAALEAWVSARCTIPMPGEKQVCCEQINLAVGGSDLHKVASVLRSLLVPDVPVVLFWNRDVTPEHLLGQLIAISDHALLDSAGDSNPRDRFRTWERMIRSFDRKSFSDLSWDRAGGWRLLIGDLFETLAMREHLKDVRTIRIEHSGSTPHGCRGFAEGCLIAGWLAQSLGWKHVRSSGMVSGQDITFIFRTMDSSVQTRIVLEEKSGAGDPGIMGVCFEHGSGRRLTCTRSNERGIVMVENSVRSTGSERIFTHIRRASDPELMVRRMDHLYGDPLFERSLRALAEFLGL
jgi:glucose-6-phosphate dehydrogenase assembly protein OpcA